MAITAQQRVSTAATQTFAPAGHTHTSQGGPRNALTGGRWSDQVICADGELMRMRCATALDSELKQAAVNIDDSNPQEKHAMGYSVEKYDKRLVTFPLSR